MVTRVCGVETGGFLVWFIAVKHVDDVIFLSDT